MGLFDLFTNKDKKSFALGSLMSYPLVEVDSKARQVRISGSMTEYQFFSLDELTDLKAGSKSLTVGVLAVYVNGIKSWECEGGKPDPKKTHECLEYIKKCKENAA